MSTSVTYQVTEPTFSFRCGGKCRTYDHKEQHRCESCPRFFSLCEKCVKSTQHEHPLIKEAVTRYSTETFYLPIQTARVDVELDGSLAKCVLKQSFTNDTSLEQEVVYNFPVDPRLVARSVVIKIGEKLIVTEIEEKNKAAEKYDDAIAAGHGAYLMNRDYRFRDVLCLNIGRLPPSATCTVETSFLAEIKPLDQIKSSFVIPSVIGHRYETDDLGRVPVKMDIVVSGNSQFKNVVCKTHPDSFKFNTLANQDSWNLWCQELMVDKDIAFEFEDFISKNHFSVIQETLIDQKGNFGSAAASIHVNLPSESHLEQDSEYVFFVDCSGSMSELEEDTRESLRLLVKSLPAGKLVNVVKFGSDFQAMWAESKRLTEETMDEIEKYIDAISSDMGGTELLPALTELFEYVKGRKINVLLLTDGGVSRTNDVVNLAKKHADNVRFFTIGLGSYPSRDLVDGLAQATGGRSDYALQTDMIAEVMMRTYSSTLESFVTASLTVGNQVIPLPGFSTNERRTFYVFVDGSSAERFTLNYKSSRTQKIECNYYSFRKSLIGEINAFAARDRIEKSEDKDEIVDLSKKHRVLSKYTAFIGIEKRNGVSGEMVERHLNKELNEQTVRLQDCGSVSMMSVYTPRGGSGIKRMAMLESASGPLSDEECDMVEECCAVVSYDSSMQVEQCLVTEQCAPVDPEPTLEEIFKTIVKTQTFTGSWTAEKAESIIDDEDLRELFGEKFVRDTLHITLWVCALLCTSFMDREAIWKFIYEKAVKYLDQQLTGSTHYDELMPKLLSKTLTLETPITLV